MDYFGREEAEEAVKYARRILEYVKEEIGKS